MADGWSVRAALEQRVGSGGVKECPDEIRDKLGLPDTDLWWVEPESEAEIAEVLRYATESGLSVIPVGNGENLEIGEAPKQADLVLSTRRLTGIVEHSVGDLTITVKTGTPFADVQAWLMQHGQWIPLTPPTENSTIGGLVAAALAGPERVLYGSWRDFVIGLRVVYPNGELIRTGGKVVKNVAGYDMNKLFVGSYGTLALITEITLKVRPYPKHRELILAESNQRTALLQLAERVLASELIPSSLELIKRAPDKYLLAIGSDEVETAARYQAERIQQMAEIIKQQAGAEIQFETVQGTQAAEFWQQQQAAWLADWQGNREADRQAVLLRAAAPLPSLDELLLRSEQAANERQITLFYTVSAGVGTMRLLLTTNSGQLAAETWLELIRWLRELAESFGGYLVIERSDKRFHDGLDVWGNVSGGLELMRGIKQTIDPMAIMSPGRFVGGI